MTAIDAKIRQRYNTIMSRISFILVALVYLCVSSFNALAATIRPNPQQSKEIEFIGVIETGDAANLEQLLAQLPKTSGQASVYFDSSDGSLNEALKIGQVLRHHLARNGQSCIGACAWAFMGGAEPGRFYEVEAGRYIYPGAKLAFRGLIRTTGQQLSRIETSRLFAYLGEMDVEREWLLHILRTEPDAVLPVETVGHLLLLDIKLAARPAIDLSLEEQAINICNHVTGWQRLLYTHYTTSEDLDGPNDLGGDGRAREVTPVEAKRAALEQIWQWRASYAQEKFPGDQAVPTMIRSALDSSDTKEVERLYDDLMNLGLPLVDTSVGTTFVVDGWNTVGAGFYTEGCLINIDDEHLDRVQAVLLQRGGMFAPPVDPSAHGYLFRFDRNFKII